MDFNGEKYILNNPLIVVLGICEYDKHIFPNLNCAINDYKNVEFAFHITRGYSMIHFDTNNLIVHKKAQQRQQPQQEQHTQEREKDKSTNARKSKVSSRNRFKLRWTEDEIFDFNKKIHSIVNSARYNYDSLIYFISCHGDDGGVIYDSDGNKVPLITIFDKFSNQNCVQLRNKPKIYFIEACRGSMRTQRLANSQLGNNSRSYENNKKKNNDKKLTITTISKTKTNSKNLSDHDESEIKVNSSLEETYSKKNKGNKNESNKNTLFSKYSSNREIYANTDGYLVVEPNNYGGYMIQSITQSIVNDNIFCKDFDSIMIHTRKIMLKLMGMSIECGAQVIQDHSNVSKRMFFKHTM